MPAERDGKKVIEGRECCALSGVEPIMPADEVIDAMRRVGRQLPASLRETGEGGCAACPLNETGRR